MTGRGIGDEARKRVALLGPALGNFAWTDRPGPVYPLDEETGWEPPDW